MVSKYVCCIQVLYRFVPGIWTAEDGVRPNKWICLCASEREKYLVDASSPKALQGVHFQCYYSWRQLRNEAVFKITSRNSKLRVWCSFWVMLAKIHAYKASIPLCTQKKTVQGNISLNCTISFRTVKVEAATPGALLWPNSCNICVGVAAASLVMPCMF